MTDGKPTFSSPELSVRQLVTATLTVGLVVAVFWLVFQFHQAFLMLLAGIIVSVALRPVVVRLQRRGLPAWASVLLIYCLIAVLAALFAVFAVPLIGRQTATIATELSRSYTDLREALANSSNLIVKYLAQSLPTALPGAEGATSVPTSPPDAAAASGTALRRGLAILGLAADVIFQIAAIFLLAYFWTLESERIKRSGLLLLPRHQRDDARELIEAIENRLSTYVSGQLLLAAIIGGLALIAYLLIGLPNALVLGLFMAIMELVPVIGPIIGAIPAVIIAFSVSPATVLWVLIALIIIHQLEANIIGPRVMKRAMDIRPLVTLTALAAFGSLFGVLGALVALPLASILQLFLDRYVLDINTSEESLADRSRVSLIRYEINGLIEDARKLVRRQGSDPLETGEQIEDLIEAIAVDLDSFLSQAGQEGKDS